MDTDTTNAVLAEVLDERRKQHEKWGQQDHPDGTDRDLAGVAESFRRFCDAAAEDGSITFRHILAEETAEAYAETDPDSLRAELIQVAAVAVAWIEAIDRRGS